MSTPSPTVQVPGGQILTEVRDAYRAAYRDRIADQNTRLTIIRFEPAPDTTTIDPAWATRLHAAQISADQKQRTAAALGAQPDLVVLSDRASAAELADVIARTNTDPNVAGIIVQTPPPPPACSTCSTCSTRYCRPRTSTPSAPTPTTRCPRPPTASPVSSHRSSTSTSRSP